MHGAEVGELDRPEPARTDLLAKPNQILSPIEAVVGDAYYVYPDGRGSNTNMEPTRSLGSSS